MAAETQYTANTGIGVISTANANLDGTGTLVTVLTAASNGTFVKTVTVKARGNSTEGMVRLFIYDGTNTKLHTEIPIPSVTKSANDPAFEITIPLNLYIEPSNELRASTEKGETFNVIAEGMNWTYYTTSVRSDTTKYTVYNAATTISTANTNLDGTGAMGTALVASNNGANIQGISFKSTVNTTAGMVRIFIYDGTSAKLWKEVPVNPTVKSATAHAFEHVVRFPDGFALKSGNQVRVATEKAETFHVVTESLEWSYPA